MRNFEYCSQDSQERVLLQSSETAAAWYLRWSWAELHFDILLAEVFTVSIIIGTEKNVLCVENIVNSTKHTRNDDEIIPVEIIIFPCSSSIEKKLKKI